MKYKEKKKFKKNIKAILNENISFLFKFIN
jgi:hypothetical protein